MALSIFDDKTKVPDNKELAEVLKDNFILWSSLKDYVFDKFPSTKEQWNYSGKNYGWSFRLRDTKRVIIYMIPCNCFFKVAFVFGQKATDEALESKLTDTITNTIKTAKVFAEGRGFRIDIMNKDLIEDVEKLISIKLKY